MELAHSRDDAILSNVLREKNEQTKILILCVWCKKRVSVSWIRIKTVWSGLCSMHRSAQQAAVKLRFILQNLYLVFFSGGFFSSHLLPYQRMYEED